MVCESKATSTYWCYRQQEQTSSPEILWAQLHVLFEVESEDYKETLIFRLINIEVPLAENWKLSRLLYSIIWQKWHFVNWPQFYTCELCMMSASLLQSLVTDNEDPVFLWLHLCLFWSMPLRTTSKFGFKWHRRTQLWLKSHKAVQNWAHKRLNLLLKLFSFKSIKTSLISPHWAMQIFLISSYNYFY